jgi:hypothetical protein
MKSEDTKIHDMLFTSQNTPHITLVNEQCHHTKKRGDLSLSLRQTKEESFIGAASPNRWREAGLELRLA